MEPDASSNVSYGECRCCLARGHHKDLTKEYFFNGVREVYSEIFADIFNLILSNNTKLTTLICTTCIHRLRDATSFRMMVVGTERQLLQAISTGFSKSTEFVNVLEEDNLVTPLIVKVESQQELKQELSEYCSALENADFDPEPSVRRTVDDTTDHHLGDHDESFVDGEAELLARFEKVSPLPIRSALPDLCPEYYKQLLLYKGKQVLPQEICKQVEYEQFDRVTRNNRRQSVTEKLAHIVNVTTVLECSNVTPFRSRNRKGLFCFYCRHGFDSLESLKEHTVQHKTREIPTVLRTYRAESIVVYVDITNLKCKICSRNMLNLDDLKLHLINIHKKKMHLDFTDIIIPFKLPGSGTYECPLCGFKYKTFGAIERHMNVHFKNYICKDCGTGFVTRYRLNVHMKSMKTGGTYPCNVGENMFTSTQKHKNNVNTVHKLMKRFKCTKCPESFTEYFRRQKHMVQVHGFGPLRFKCNVCDKSFNRRYTLSRHVNRYHLQER